MATIGHSKKQLPCEAVILVRQATFICRREKKSLLPTLAANQLPSHQTKAAINCRAFGWISDNLVINLIVQKKTRETKVMMKSTK